MNKSGVNKESFSIEELMMNRLLTYLLPLILGLAACQTDLKDTSEQTIGSQSLVQQGFAPQAGDQIWVRVFSEKGDELVFEKFDVTEENLSTWRGDLTRTLNEGAARKYLRVDLGPAEVVSSEKGQTWLKNSEHSYVIGLSH